MTLPHDSQNEKGSAASRPTQVGRALVLHQTLLDRLRASFPDADEETLFDTVEGLTDLHEQVAAVVRSSLEDQMFASALGGRIDEMRGRLDRFEQRAAKKRDLVTAVLAQSGIKRLQQPDFTVSLRQLPPLLAIRDEGQIPDGYWVPQPPKLDRRKLLTSLKEGRRVPGADLSNGGVSLTVRIK